MNIEIKKDLTSNWFKFLQNAICHSISDFENNKLKFETTTWKRNNKKDEGVVSIDLKTEKFLTKLELIFQKFMENFQNNFKKIY